MVTTTSSIVTPLYPPPLALWVRVTGHPGRRPGPHRPPPSRLRFVPVLGREGQAALVNGDVPRLPRNADPHVPGRLAEEHHLVGVAAALVTVSAVGDTRTPGSLSARCSTRSPAPPRVPGTRCRWTTPRAKRRRERMMSLWAVIVMPTQWFQLSFQNSRPTEGRQVMSAPTYSSLPEGRSTSCKPVLVLPSTS